MVFYKWQGDPTFLDNMRKEEKKKQKKLKEMKKIYNKRYYVKKEKKYCKYCCKSVIDYTSHKKSEKHQLKKFKYKN